MLAVAAAVAANKCFGRGGGDEGMSVREIWDSRDWIREAMLAVVSGCVILSVIFSAEE